jgi:hypothetical protein
MALAWRRLAHTQVCFVFVFGCFLLQIFQVFAFQMNRDKWNSYVVPYVPTFMDGWTPDASFFPDEKEENKRSNVMNFKFYEFFSVDS